MHLDLDTFLTVLYTLVDDLYHEHLAPFKPSRPGRRPDLSDSEVLTLALCAQWVPVSERTFVRYARQHWRSYFPRLLSPSAFNRRVRDLAGCLLRLTHLLAERLDAAATVYQVVDTVPVPLMRRCRGQRQRLFDAEIAAIGRGGSDQDWYYGCKLLLATTAEGAITGFLLAPATTADVWLLEHLLSWRSPRGIPPWTAEDLPPSHKRGGQRTGPTGRIWPREGAGAFFGGPYLTDQGFRGRRWREHWGQDGGTTVVRSGAEAGPLRRRVAAWRQIGEQVNGLLQGVFHLGACGARTVGGLWARIAAKTAACNMGQWITTHLGLPRLALLGLCL